MRIVALFWITAGLCFSCESNPDCCSDAPQTYLGSWLLSESGYSIGAGYNVKQISTDPAQILTLEENGELSSTVNDLQGYKYFKIVTGDGNEDDEISFYKTASDRQSSTNERTYSIVFGEDVLKLSFHYCIEGCHLGFVPVK